MFQGILQFGELIECIHLVRLTYLQGPLFPVPRKPDKLCYLQSSESMCYLEANKSYIFKLLTTLIMKS